MNKEEALKLAHESGMAVAPVGNGYWDSTEELLAFANACEKIGMEKAAKICDSSMRIDAADCAEAIRKAIE